MHIEQRSKRPIAEFRRVVRSICFSIGKSQENHGRTGKARREGLVNTVKYYGVIKQGKC